MGNTGFGYSHVTQVTFGPTEHQPPNTAEPRQDGRKRKRKRNGETSQREIKKPQLEAQLGSRTTGARHLSG